MPCQKKIPSGPNKKGLSCKTKSTVEKLFSRFSLLLYKIRHDVRSTYIFNRTQGEDQEREVEQGTHLSFAMSEVSVAHDPSKNPKKKKKNKVNLFFAFWNPFFSTGIHDQISNEHGRAGSG